MKNIKFAETPKQIVLNYLSKKHDEAQDFSHFLWECGWFDYSPKNVEKAFWGPYGGSIYRKATQQQELEIDTFQQDLESVYKETCIEIMQKVYEVDATDFSQTKFHIPLKHNGVCYGVVKNPKIINENSKPIPQPNGVLKKPEKLEEADFGWYVDGFREIVIKHQIVIDAISKRVIVKRLNYYVVLQYISKGVHQIIDEFGLEISLQDALEIVKLSEETFNKITDMLVYFEVCDMIPPYHLIIKMQNAVNYFYSKFKNELDKFAEACEWFNKTNKC